MGKDVNELKVNHMENLKNQKKFELRNEKDSLCVHVCEI